MDLQTNLLGRKIYPSGSDFAFEIVAVWHEEQTLFVSYIDGLGHIVSCRADQVEVISTYDK